MEKLGFDHAPPGLQDQLFNHYDTAASQSYGETSLPVNWIPAIRQFLTLVCNWRQNRNVCGKQDTSPYFPVSFNLMPPFLFINVFVKVSFLVIQWPS